MATLPLFWRELTWIRSNGEQFCPKDQNNESLGAQCGLGPYMQIKPGYLGDLLPKSAPTHPDTLEDVLKGLFKLNLFWKPSFPLFSEVADESYMLVIGADIFVFVMLDVKEKILPGITHWQSPSFFAYYPSNCSIAAFLGEMLSAGFNVVGFSWITSPAETELEIIVLDWLAKALGLPQSFRFTGQGGGVIQGSASEAILVSLLAARDKVLRRVGKDAIGNLVVYCSDQTHSAFKKSCQIVGIHPNNCRVQKTDASTDYALSPKLLNELITQDVKAGLVPFFLCSTVGSTSSTAVDPLLALGNIAKSNGIWFHVDAAYAGSALICPELRYYIDGVEEADSFNMNPHKWFLTNSDCAALWLKDRSALIHSLSTNPEFLKNKASENNVIVDYKDWQIPLGRRFRSLKLWMVLRLYGVKNIQAYIRNHINLAKQFEDLVSQDPRFEVVTPRKFSLVCFRLVHPQKDEELINKLNHDLLDAVNSSGKIHLSHTVLSGKFTLRLAVGAPLTEARHIIAAWKVFQDEARFRLAYPLDDKIKSSVVHNK